MKPKTKYWIGFALLKLTLLIFVIALLFFDKISSWYTASMGAVAMVCLLLGSGLLNKYKNLKNENKKG